MGRPARATQAKEVQGTIISETGPGGQPAAREGHGVNHVADPPDPPPPSFSVFAISARAAPHRGGVTGP